MNMMVSVHIQFIQPVKNEYSIKDNQLSVKFIKNNSLFLICM